MGITQQRCGHLATITLATYVSFQPGRLKGVQAMGWYMEEANMAQVSINISDHEETPLHTVYEEVLKEAKVSQSFFTYWHCAPPCLQCFDAVGWVAGRASGL